MSGGERKAKRLARTQGWEEAGGEFYSESYPGGEIDLEALQHNPSHIATLLPSKQNRTATCKKRRDAKSTVRRRTSTRSRYHSTARRPSVATGAVNDVSSMLPDLSENLSNEERTWEEIMQIKAMPVNMTQKKEMKMKLQNATKLRLQGLDQLKWQRRKLWTQLRQSWGEAWSKLELWKNSMKRIEGHLGTGVVAYFLFIKWLMFLNLAICIIIGIFIMVPAVFLTEQIPPVDCSNFTLSSSYDSCSNVSRISAITSLSTDDLVLQIVQGTGFMEHTVAFYGWYPDSVLVLSANAGLYYDLPLAYISISLAFVLVSLAAIMKSAAQGFKERLLEGEGQFYKYCNLVFAGWDYCIQNDKSAQIKHKALFNEMKACLEADNLEEERASRSREERIKLWLVRFFVNIVVFLILVAGLFLIFYSFQYSIQTLPIIPNGTLDALLLEFLPSMCIVGLNLIVPTLLNVLVRLERYSPLSVIRLTLFRTILLRLASLGVLLASFYNLFNCPVLSRAENSESCFPPPCWETYVGQQLYKLMLVDLVSQIGVTFLINFPRAFIARHTRNRVIRFLGEQEFNLPKHVLDVVYSQALCWLGSFYAPILPAMATVTFFFMFHIKKFACLVNSRPAAVVYRASRSNALFMVVLLFTFVVVVVPLGYMVAEQPPSRKCGPFRGLPTVWSLVVQTFQSLPSWMRSVAFFFGTASFAVPMFVVLILCLCYYHAVSAANKHMVEVLRHQLRLEGQDKQFLLHRLSSFIRQQQEHHKAMRTCLPQQQPRAEISSST